MAKRTVQLQAELFTDEDFESFLLNPGLLVIEVYSEWCGPCLGIVGSLRRIKYIVGDLLSLAIARSDTISYVHRFYKRSEPAWLFVVQGRAVNIMFGTDYPRLAKLIKDEIHILPKFYNRETYAITELLPEEIKRDRIKNEARDRKLREENAEKERKKMEYFTYVTEMILENLPDAGITIFGPHINRDLFRRLMEIGNEKLGIQCKDRRNQPITKEQFEFINTVCTNPLSADVIDAMNDKEFFICFWKIPDDRSNLSVAEVLELYADEISKKHVLPPDEYRDTEEIQPPLISSLKLTVEYELPEDQVCPHEAESEPDTEPETKKPKPHETQQEEIDVVVEDNFSEMGSEEYEELPDEPKLQSMMGIELSDPDRNNNVEEEEEYMPEGPKPNICQKTLDIPGIWVPKDSLTHAAVIYLLFRQQTVGFLPPDPVPEPPHVIMAFNTYKQRDLIDFAERYKEDIPLYGYFTSDDADEAKFIANSKQNYAHHTHSASDKLVFKVNKRTSHTMLSLVTYGPTYVSFNTEVGKEEALKFFPENYVTAEQELLQLAEAAKEEKKNKKKSKDQKDVESYNKLQEEAERKAAEEAALRELEEQAQREAELLEQIAEGELIGVSEAENEGEALEGGDIGEGAEMPPNTSPEDAVNATDVAEETPAAELPEKDVEATSPADGPTVTETVETPV